MLRVMENERNTYDIVVREYVPNVDLAITTEYIQAVGKIALQQCDFNGIVDRILQFLNMEKDYITIETLVLIVKGILRNYPHQSHDYTAVVGNISGRNVLEPKAKVAMDQMSVEYCQDIVEKPLETYSV